MVSITDCERRRRVRPKRWLYLLLLSLATKVDWGKSSPSDDSVHQRHTRRRRLRSSVTCRLTIVDTSYEEQENVFLEGGNQTFTSWKSSEDYVACIPLIGDDQDVESDALLPLPDFPVALRRQYEAELDIGNLWVTIEGVSWQPGDVDITLQSDIADMAYTVLSTSSLNHHRRQLQRDQHSYTTGRRTIAIVRISTLDSTPTVTKAQLENMFNPNEINLHTQYLACSHGQLDWRLSRVVDVTVRKPVSDFTGGSTLVNLAQDVLRNKNIVTSSAQELGDKVFFIVPPGTGNWAASAAVHHFRSQYNDVWGLSLSGTTHELGHNLGLLHSNEGVRAYADSTGYMGFGFTDPHWPQKCFNGHKHWLLDWYSRTNQALTLSNLQRQGPQLVRLAAFVDAQQARDDEPVLVNVHDKIFVQYNRAKSFNIDTGEKKNQVTLTAGGSSSSDGLAGLGLGGVHVVKRFRGLKRLVVEVCRMESRNGVDLAIVSIGLDESLCNAPTKRPTSAPIPVPTPVPTTGMPSVAPTPSPTGVPTTDTPSVAPTPAPTQAPTPAPTTDAPTDAPTEVPTTDAPTVAPTMVPTTDTPSVAPTTDTPSVAPTATASVLPTAALSVAPTATASVPPTAAPTENPSTPPSPTPTKDPLSVAPSSATSASPTIPTKSYSLPHSNESVVGGATVSSVREKEEGDPSRNIFDRHPFADKIDRLPTPRPSSFPSSAPSRSPSPSLGPSTTHAPSSQPTSQPSNEPSLSFQPSHNPSHMPSNIPSTSQAPSSQPTSQPSHEPSFSFQPSLHPSHAPSSMPSSSSRPSAPSNVPSDLPSDTHSDAPSDLPSDLPSDVPSDLPSNTPSWEAVVDAGPTDKGAVGLVAPPPDNLVGGAVGLIAPPDRHR